ncbi:MAG: 4Fe-4S dicluster domain-containing protein [Planctomycetaceae bacterium]|jgi:heterodisulfide reductase subunit C|nr:4Fe-4S dicluster domain-containing protein [Planctomycetaceae bacterium]
MHKNTNPAIALVESIAHTSVADCYQCGKCSAGCPQADKMDVLPSVLIRMVQNGDVKEAAATESTWLCVGCLTCSARCPKSVNIAGVLDALKQISIRKNCIDSKYRRTVTFQKAFLNNVRRNGRTNELEMVAEFKIAGFLNDFSIPLALKDAMFGPSMFFKGKLHLKPGSPVKDKALVKRIFDKCSKLTENENDAVE